MKVADKEAELPRIGFSPDQVAVMTGVSLRAVRKEIATGRLKISRVGRRVVITRDRIIEWLAAAEAREAA